MPRESFAQGQQVTPADRLRPFLPASTLTPRPAHPPRRFLARFPTCIWLQFVSTRKIVEPEIKMGPGLSRPFG